MNNVMLDLETLDTRSTGTILSIGAVLFDKTGLGKEFYRTVDAQSCFDAGLTVSGSTFKWWMAQKAEARKALFEDNVPLQDALFAFTTFLHAHSTGDPKVWGNGSDFDNAMLAHAYNKLGMEIPWQFWNNRCYRTTCDILNDRVRKQEGVHHNALDDAKSQASHLRKVFTARAVW
jgi:exodeoxyribonuclease VIII